MKKRRPATGGVFKADASKKQKAGASPTFPYRFSFSASTSVVKAHKTVCVSARRQQIRCRSCLPKQIALLWLTFS
jgi:hypothetical protein